MRPISFVIHTAVLAVVMGGCKGPAKGTATPDGPADADADTDADTDTDTVIDTAPTGDTGPEPIIFDCATIPVNPPDPELVQNAKGYHDVAFTPDGYLIGAANGNNNLLAVDSQGASRVFVPGIGLVQQMVLLPDGDLAVASADNGIVRVAPNGSVVPINGSIQPYGLILGPDQMLYSANQDVVHRVDPNTGQAQIIVPRNALTNGSPRVINFSLDNTKLYIGTYEGRNGKVYVVDLDANFDPVSLPQVFAEGVGSGDYHDGLGVDICGYLYMPDYSTSSLFRISPTGAVQRMFKAPGFSRSEYPHGLEWGNGVGGWRDDALYMPLPYGSNNVSEYRIGVPSRDWTLGTAINLP